MNRSSWILTLHQQAQKSFLRTTPSLCWRDAPLISGICLSLARQRNPHTNPARLEQITIYIYLLGFQFNGLIHQTANLETLKRPSTPLYKTRFVLSWQGYPLSGIRREADCLFKKACSTRPISWWLHEMGKSTLLVLVLNNIFWRRFSSFPAEGNKIGTDVECSRRYTFNNKVRLRRFWYNIIRATNPNGRGSIFPSACKLSPKRIFYETATMNL